MRAYSWTSACRPTINAQVFGETVGDRKKLTADELLEIATPAESAIHAAFEWDDAVAGHEYRLTEARKLIRSLRCTIVVKGRPPEPPMRVFIHVETRKLGRTYVIPATILTDAEARNSAILDCLRLLAGIRSRFAYLKELDSVWLACDNVRQTM